MSKSPLYRNATNGLVQEAASTDTVGPIANPTSAQDAATKNYVDTGVSALSTGLFTKALLLPANRAVGTIFQNTTGKDIIVHAVVGGSATPSSANALIGASSPPTSVVCQATTQNGFAIDFKFVVPNNYFYEVVSTAGSVVTGSWTEVSITTGNVSISADLVGTRVLGTAVQNTSGFAKLIIVVLSSVTATSTGAPMQGLCDTSNPPTTQIFGLGQPSTGGATMFLMVPNNNYYKFTATTGTVAHWWEITLPFNATQSLNLASTTNAATNGTLRQISTSAIQTTYQAGGAVSGFKDLWLHVTQAPSNTSTSLMFVGGFSGSTGTTLPSGLLLISEQSNATSNSSNTSAIVMVGEGYIVRSDGTPTLQEWFEYKLS